MKEVITTMVIPIVAALISYWGARQQANAALLSVQLQQNAELQRLKDQQNLEIQKMKEQQTAENQRIREQYLHEIEVIKVQMDKQAEIYEKNAQTDMVAKTIEGIMEGNISGLDNLMKFDKKINSKAFKSNRKFR